MVPAAPRCQRLGKEQSVRKLRWVLLIALLLVFVCILLFGIYQGDAEFVLDNAKAFCFT